MQTPEIKPRASPPPQNREGGDAIPSTIRELAEKLYPHPGTRKRILAIIEHRVSVFLEQGRLDNIKIYLRDEEALMREELDEQKKTKRRGLISLVGKSVFAALIGLGVQFAAYRFGFPAIW